MIVSYLKQVMSEIGRSRYIWAMVLLVSFTLVNCLQPYFLSRIIADGLHYNYLLLFMVSLLMPAAINFIKNYLVQVIRKSSKKILLLFLALRGYDYYDDYKSSTLQSVISEISFVCRNLVQETLLSIVLGSLYFFIVS